jgi:epoxyqueuosine reductase
MAYLSRTADRRADVRAVLPTARSVISLATVYNVDRPYSTELESDEVARLARYAWGDDYHVVIEKRMRELLAWMGDESDSAFDARAYVDTGPVQERVFAQQAGLGWIGKHTCLINPDLGSWVFLSVILTSLELEPDTPALDQCGTCTLCIEACPTDAIVEPWVLDVTRCLSYLTIEIRGGVPPDQRDDIGAHVFGCDICQDVCPWNASAAQSVDSSWMPREGFDRATIVDLWNRPDAELSALLKGSSMKRTGLRRLRRNLAVALGNTPTEASRRAIESKALHRATAPSLDDPMVMEHVAWARAKLDRS